MINPLGCVIKAVSCHDSVLLLKHKGSHRQFGITWTWQYSDTVLLLNTQRAMGKGYCKAPNDSAILTFLFVCSVLGCVSENNLNHFDSKQFSTVSTN